MNKKFLLILIVIFISGHFFCFRAEGLSRRGKWSFIFSDSDNDIQPGKDVNGWELLSPYAQTSWPTIHRDSRNSDYLPFVTTSQLELKWHALQDEFSAVLTAVVIGPEGNIYFTTGKEEGYGNLHAFDREGNELWRSYLLDNGALCGAPLVDREGDLYAGDSDEFFGFHSDGTLKWKSSNLEGPFPSSVFSLDGHIIGIGGNGTVYVFDPQDGHLVAYPLDLPGESPGNAYKINALPGLWPGMVSDGENITANEIFNGLLGYQFKVTNTPAVNPANGRIYITSTVKTSTDVQGRFYGIDFIESSGKVQLAFQTEMEPGSGSSPAISPDCSRIYALDNAGTLYAFDTEGQKIWTIEMLAKPASPAIGPDGTIYAVSGSQLFAVTDAGDSGKISWQINLAETAAGKKLLNSSSLLSLVEKLPYQRVKPALECNSVVSVSRNHLYLTVASGYELGLQESTISYLYPQKSFLMVLTPSSNSKTTQPKISSVTEIPDTAESVITLDKDGTVFCAHGSVTSSMAYSISKNLGFNFKKPTGGVSVLGPPDQRDLVNSQIRWVRNFINKILQALRQGKLESACTQLNEPMVQLQAMKESLDNREGQNEGENEIITKSKEDIAMIYSQIEAARDILEDIKNNTANINKQGAKASQAKTYLRSASSMCRRMLFSNLRFSGLGGIR